MFYSIVTLTYKRPELLEESVYSVLQQTYTDWELIIINDCNYQTVYYNHPQVKVFNVKERFKTIADKRNFGLLNCKGDWILQLDDDDFLLPSYLEDFKEIIGNAEWMCCQRPIIYSDDINKIFLSPVPQSNAFFFSKKIAEKFKYEAKGTNELNPFYDLVKREFKGIKRSRLLFPNQCGHVWRQDMDERRKYSLAHLIQNNISQEQWNEKIGVVDDEVREIFLEPKWRIDYTSVIRENIKQTDAKFIYDKIKGGQELWQIAQDVLKEYNLKGNIEGSVSGSIEAKISEDLWTKVKPSWSNALKFIQAARSRGLVSTTLDVVGFDVNSGERVSDETLKQRRLSCFGDESQNIKKCDRLQKNSKGSFCSSCGCGDREVARLDSENPNDYTKLHYPKLECPLKKRGFSNYDYSEYIKISDKVPLSIIIPVLNDNKELNLTIESIRNTTPPNVEIIIIDDASAKPAIVDDKNVKLIRLETRLGVGSTRHLGATKATSDYLLFVDSHMRFDPNWYNNAMNRLISNPENVVWCAVCLGLEEGCMELRKHKGAYCGAKLVLYDEKENQVFEGKWIDEKPEEEYEISCLMGACYFFHKSWFFHIGGTQSLRMWGSDEPLLSAKTYLAGGTIKLAKNVRMGHKFRSVAPYATGTSYIIYNKLRSMYMIFSEELYNKLVSKIQDDSNKQEALKMLERDKNEIEKEKQYYKTIFIRDEKWLCDKIDFKL